MKKIAILGCENSHAEAFLNAVRKNEAFADVEVIGVYSDERPAMEKLRDKFGVAMMADYAEAVGKIDGLVVTARHGGNHYKYAKPYIDSGIPMFIDKPITATEAEAIAFMRELRARGVRVSGGSSLKQDVFVRQLRQEAEQQVGGPTLGGYVRAPFEREHDYGGFSFYAQHLVEMVCEIFGRFPLSVAAKENGRQIHVLFHYENYDCVGLYCDENYHYYVSRMSRDASTGFKIPTSNSGDWFREEFKEFYGLLSGEKQTLTYEEFIAPVFIINAIERSIQSGKEEPVNKIAL